MKMVVFCVHRVADPTRCGRLISIGTLLLIAAYHVPLATGQQVGVSLKLQGTSIPNNSLVDVEDILYRASIDGYREKPSNANPTLHDEALLCVTDLEDCCEIPRTVRGNWYYPDGRIVNINNSISGPTFQSNRGPNELVNNNRQFYGSVRLWRRWSNPPERGRFRCELPSAADPSVNQVLYANLVNFGTHHAIDPVTISPSGPGITGNTFSLTCSAQLIDPIPLPHSISSPNFEWFFGENGTSVSLPSGVTPMETVLKSGYIYSSTLQFSPVLKESHAGMYTCRLGAGRLINSILVSVDVVAARVIPSGTLMLGHDSSYTLTCRVFVTNNFRSPSITYQWIKNNDTPAVQVGETEPDTLSFISFRLSDAGLYTCYATISSSSLGSDISVTASHEVKIQIPAPTSVVPSASSPTPVQQYGTITCTVRIDLSPEMDIPLTVNTALRGPGGYYTMMNTSQPVIGGSIATYTSTFMISSLLGRNLSGNYICVATLSPTLDSAYIISSRPREHSVQFMKNGVYLMLRNQFIANNSQVNIRNIGASTDDPSSALQCITDKFPCCMSQDPQHGEWYLPNGELVQGIVNTSDTALYRSRGDNGEVSLNRPSNITSPTAGRYCCAVANAANINQTLCVIIGIVSITPIGSPIAGEDYSLECSAGGSMAILEWLGPPDHDGRTAVIDSLTIISNSSTSQLRFRPLEQSHSGIYSCHNNISGHLSSSLVLNVTAPNLSIEITDSGGVFPMAGQNHDIICGVRGAENLNSTITYLWNNETGNNNSKSLSFAPVRISDAGISYFCLATVVSNYLSVPGHTVLSPGYKLIIKIPTPSFITLSKSTESDIALILCTVELNPAILESEVPLLRVGAQLSRDGALLTLARPTVTNTTFTYTTQLNLTKESDYGSYTCTATIRPKLSSIYLIGIDKLLSDSLAIEPAIPPPVGVQATQFDSSAPVEISWSPPSYHGPFKITGYRIFYGNRRNNYTISVSVGATSIGVGVNESYDGQTVFICSESNQLYYSELVVVTVTMATCSCSRNQCWREIGTTVGVMVCVIVITVIVIIVSLRWIWWRRRSPAREDIDIALSNNVAYEEVTWKPKAAVHAGNYENGSIYTIAKPTQQ